MTPPQAELAWLQRLVGNWVYESEIAGNANNAATTDRGTETVRSLDDMWFILEGRDESSTGGKNNTILTLGYDHTRKQLVGTFVGTMMDKIWMYEGDLDTSSNSAVLFSEGPSFLVEGANGKYKDVIEMRTPDHRVFTSNYLDESGAWKQFMSVHYRRASH